MAKKKKLRNSRNTEYNYSYGDNKTIKSSTMTVTSSKRQMDVTLLNYNDAVVKTGQEIKSIEVTNPNTPKDTNPYYHGKINTENLNNADNYSIYGSPHKMVLDDRQQYNNCGVDSVLNILVMAGLKTIQNQNRTETDFTRELWNMGLVEDSGTLGRLDIEDGGSVPINYVDFLSRYGISSTAYASNALGGSSEGAAETTTLENIADVVKEGGAAILAVSSKFLWGTDESDYTLDHAITVTGVVYDNSDNLVGFYIHDTGLWMTRYISVEDLKQCTLYDTTTDWKTQTGVFGTVTEKGIKERTFNLNLSGSRYDDILSGNNNNNVIKGYNGNDTINGNGGDDTLYGGNGNDTIDGGEGNNRVYGDNGNDLILTASGNDYIRGGNNDDKIDAGAGNDTIYGDNGNDIIVGRAGNDTIRGGNGNDWIFANEGISINGSLNYSDLNDDWALDQVTGQATTIEGKNTIYGDNGNDHIFGGDYADTINGGNGHDVIYGRGGNDILYGGNGNDIIYGGEGIDVIYGGNNNDTIYGGDGDDRIFGQNGNDTINGGAGDDVIICGSGRDRVIINSDEGIDRISASGSVTFKIDKSATDIDFTYSSDYSTVKVYYDDYDGFEYQGFFNSKRNRYQSAVIEDSEGNSYKMSATRSNGRISVANKKGNNIMFSTSMNNNTVTTSDYNDIVWMRGGDNTISYTGGRDKYYSGGDESYKSGRYTLHTEGDDTYIVNNFDNNSYLSINDSISNDTMSYNPSDNDSLRINTNSNIGLFFDMAKDGSATGNDNLYIISPDSTITDYSSLFDEKGSGYISITDYFSQDNKVSESRGEGYIEHIYTNNSQTELNITTAVDQIQSAVTSWLSDTAHSAYDSVASVLSSSNEADISSLLACFTGNK